MYSMILMTVAVYCVMYVWRKYTIFSLNDKVFRL